MEKEKNEDSKYGSASSQLNMPGGQKAFVNSGLFRPISIASLVFFRIAFGILAFADVTGIFSYYHLYKGDFNPQKFQFHYYGFEWVNPLPEPFMSLFFISLLIATVLIVLGKWYHWATTYFAFGFAWLFLLEKAHYLNHGYLFCCLAFVMIFLPAQRFLSLDARQKPAIRTRTIPFWSMAILPFLMGGVYFFGGIAKINPDWTQAIPLKLWLKAKDDFFLIGPILAKESTAWLMSYAGLLLDLTVVFFLLNKRTRKWAFAAAVFFHVTNSIIFNIGIFPWLSISLTALFFAPDFPLQFIQKIKNGQSKFALFLADKINIFPPVEDIKTPNLWQNNIRYKWVIITSLIVLMLLQFTLPLRHHLYTGNVAWNEEGHRYAWRMMLRSKRGYGVFKVEDALSDKFEFVNPKDSLSKKQSRKLFTHPDMILEYAHFLRDAYTQKGWQPKVFVDTKVNLNNKGYQVFIDPKVDLAKEKWSFFKHSEWVMPFKN